MRFASLVRNTKPIPLPSSANKAIYGRFLGWLLHVPVTQSNPASSSPFFFGKILRNYQVYCPPSSDQGVIVHDTSWQKEWPENFQCKMKKHWAGISYKSESLSMQWTVEFEIENTAVNQAASQLVTKQSRWFHKKKDRARKLLTKGKKGLFFKPRTASLGRNVGDRGESKGIYHVDWLFFLWGMNWADVTD